MLKFIIRKDILIRSIKFSIVVGIILGAINHGDHIINGNMTLNNWLKIGITFCVPFCVSTFSSILAIKKEQTTKI